MKRFSISLILFATLSIVASSCNWLYQDVEIHDIHNIELVKIEADGMLIEADVTIKNPNFYSITALNSNLKIYLDEVLLGRAEFVNSMKLEPKSEEIRHVEIKARYSGKLSSTLKGVLGLAMGKKTKLLIEGTVEGKALGITRDFELRIEEEVQL